jgi:uncharacterized membrane protein
METTEKKLTAEESIQIIQQMISNTKTSLGDNSYHYLLWGWLSIVASVGNYILLKTPVGLNSYFIWFLLPLIGMPLSYYYKKKYHEKSQTHLGFFIRNLWTGISITSAIMFVLIYFVYFQVVLMFLLLLGTAIFITGAVTKFKPLVAGAIFFWAGAICCAFLKNPSGQLLIYAITIFSGYIIPGYILKFQYKKRHV